MIIMGYWNYIKNLEKWYSETNVSKGEELTRETRSVIDKNYKKNQRKRRIDVILNNVKNKNSLKEEVHDLADNLNFQKVCRTCKEETIIAVIILYVQRRKNPRFRIEQSRLWREYNLSWRLYGLIIERLLKLERENKPIRTNKQVDNEKWIYW